MQIELSNNDIQTLVVLLNGAINVNEAIADHWDISNEFHPLISENKGLRELIEKLENVKET